MSEGSCRSVDREEWGELPIRGREAELEVGEAQGRAEGEVGLVEGRKTCRGPKLRPRGSFLAGGGVTEQRRRG